jgi:hypothetical protein
VNSDATLVLTEHNVFDHIRIVRLAASVINTQNAPRNVATNRDKIIVA